MKILTRYILKEFFPPFLLALLCFTSFLLLNEIFRLTKLFVRKGISPRYLIELLIYVLPATLVITIPMATLVGILLSLGRLSTDNEITAMKAHGVGFHQILLPLLLVSSLLSVFDLFFMDYALPRGNVAYAALKRDISTRNSAFVLEEGVVMKELERKGRVWMYESTDPQTGRLQNVKVWDSIWSGQPRFIHATEATVGFKNKQAWLTLYDGVTYEPISGSDNGFRTTAFEEDQIALDFTETLERREFESQSPRSMEISRLKAHITNLKRRLSPTESESYLIDKLRYAQVEYHKKFSIPFACFVFGLIGVPLGLVVKRSGKMVGFGIGLGLILVYYLLLQIGQDTGRNGVFPPGFAMWLPNIVIGAVGLGFTARTILEGRLETRRSGGQKLPPIFDKEETPQVGESD
ncbi:MAG: LptF/LptG family permease [Candidatus Poribacteria bacterium]|nr:LptF/LptG family permease [Candidatus Poribacteria bacterium]